MSQVWVPWPENPNRYKLAGLKGLVWRPVLLFYALFKRFPAVLFFGGGVVLCLLIWAGALLFAFVQNDFLDDSTINDAAMVSYFGGELSLSEVEAGVQQHISTETNWLAYLLYPLGHEFIRDLVALVGVLIIIALIPLFFTWWERKVSGHIQSRLGPMRVGGWHGWTQSVADAVKVIAKEDFVPKEGDGPMFRLAPYLVFVPVVMSFIALPFGSYWIFRHSEVGLLFVLAMLGVEVVGVILAGWASNNKWSIFGAMREACQMVSYEIPMGMALLLPIMLAGTLSLNSVGAQQSGGWFTWYCFANPFLFAAAIAYYIACLASCKRAPFDLAEAESELVAGFLTEYSGFRWSMFFFGEYCAMFVVSGLATILFFGAWYSPLPEELVAAWLSALNIEGGLLKTGIMGLAANGPLWFILKATLLLYVQIWLRWTLPRIRIDQLLYACVQVMLPVVMLLLLGNTVWILLVPEGGVIDTVSNYTLGIIGAIFVVSFLIVAARGFRRRRQLVGYLAVDVLPGS